MSEKETEQTEEKSQSVDEAEAVEDAKEDAGEESTDEPLDDEPLTTETVVLTHDGEDRPVSDGSASPKSEALEPVGKQDGALPSSLRSLGLKAGDWPTIDPDTGEIEFGSGDLGEGAPVFIYNSNGRPVFGYLLQDGGLVISPEEGATAVIEVAPPAAPAPAEEVTEEETAGEVREEAAEATPEAPTEKPKKKKKKKKKKKSSEKGTVGLSQAERRERALAKAQVGGTKRSRVRRPQIAAQSGHKKKSPFGAVMFLSSLVCLGILGWHYFGPPPSEDEGDNAAASQTMTFTPVAFTPFEMDVNREPLEAGQERLLAAGWTITVPEQDPKWAQWQSGCIDSGMPNARGTAQTIQKARQGKGGFQVAIEAGFLKQAGDQPHTASNVAIMLYAKNSREELFFGYGPGIGKAFMVHKKGSRKLAENLHQVPVILQYNTWYKLEARADGEYVNFYFNGIKLDGLQVPASAVTHIALQNYQSRVIYRNIRIDEEGVAKPKPETTAAN